ncbi:helix-turn-helix domain-containing protein [Streptomyces sp. NPDC002476]|uniref:helix-turn-helix domain-containing protein n=1 Tax=Streptomyces sp. NPDC002476 TaxID=3364648 RepID=UPI0036B6F5B2
MPERVFDPEGFHAARRRRDLKQPQVAKALQVNTNQVSRYETGDNKPPAEKLPAMAELVGLSLDELAPRYGLPDLRDLRCDAGIQQKETAEITGTKSAMPVRAAEKGMRRLSPNFLEPLAERYGVTVEELKAAQERSFGNPVPDVRRSRAPRAIGPGTPQTLSEKITYLLEQTYAVGEHPSDAELAGRGNMKTDRSVLSEELVRALRTGTEATEDKAVLEALAAAMDAPVVFFTSDNPEEAARIVAGIRTVQLGVMAARGSADGPLDTQWLDFISKSLSTIVEQQQPDGPAPGDR